MKELLAETEASSADLLKDLAPPPFSLLPIPPPSSRQLRFGAARSSSAYTAESGHKSASPLETSLAFARSSNVECSLNIPNGRNRSRSQTKTASAGISGEAMSGKVQGTSPLIASLATSPFQISRNLASAITTYLQRAVSHEDGANLAADVTQVKEAHQRLATLSALLVNPDYLSRLTENAKQSQSQRGGLEEVSGKNRRLRGRSVPALLHAVGQRIGLCTRRHSHSTDRDVSHPHRRQTIVETSLSTDCSWGVSDQQAMIAAMKKLGWEWGEANQRLWKSTDASDGRTTARAPLRASSSHESDSPLESRSWADFITAYSMGEDAFSGSVAPPLPPGVPPPTFCPDASPSRRTGPLRSPAPPWERERLIAAGRLGLFNSDCFDHETTTQLCSLLEEWRRKCDLEAHTLQPEVPMVSMDHEVSSLPCSHLPPLQCPPTVDPVIDQGQGAPRPSRLGLMLITFTLSQALSLISLSPVRTPTSAERDMTMTSHNVLFRDDVTVIPDAANDWRTRGNPFSNLARSFAIWRIVNAAGMPIASVCVFARHVLPPTYFSRSLIDQGRSFARRVGELLEAAHVRRFLDRMERMGATLDGLAGVLDPFQDAESARPDITTSRLASARSTGVQESKRLSHAPTTPTNVKVDCKGCLPAIREADRSLYRSSIAVAISNANAHRLEKILHSLCSVTGMTVALITVLYEPASLTSSSLDSCSGITTQASSGDVASALSPGKAGATVLATSGTEMTGPVDELDASLYLHALSVSQESVHFRRRELSAECDLEWISHLGALCFQNFSELAGGPTPPWASSVSSELKKPALAEYAASLPTPPQSSHDKEHPRASRPTKPQAYRAGIVLTLPVTQDGLGSFFLTVLTTSPSYVVGIEILRFMQSVGLVVSAVLLDCIMQGRRQETVTAAQRRDDSTSSQNAPELMAATSHDPHDPAAINGLSTDLIEGPRSHRLTRRPVLHPYCVTDSSSLSNPRSQRDDDALAWEVQPDICEASAHNMHRAVRKQGQPPGSLPLVVSPAALSPLTMRRRSSDTLVEGVVDGVHHLGFNSG